MRKAVFLDRDGVLVEDVDLLTKYEDIKIFNDVVDALRQLKKAGYELIIISNQTVVARGMVNEKDVVFLQDEIEKRLVDLGSPKLDGFYFCPHHPNATLPQYRKDCDCRKPKPGLILQAAKEHDIDLTQSFMIGDRITDIIAGSRAGCRTILVETGAHSAPPIQTSESLDMTIQPDYICSGLASATCWILGVL